MRQEAKEVDGRDIEQAEERRRENELVKEDDEELLDLDGKPELEHDHDRTPIVVGAMRDILEREHVIIDALALDKRERRALEALKTAVDGRDNESDGFVFAEDRRALLEQALAVLQPELVDFEKLDGTPFEGLVQEVAGLRMQLRKLEAAQRELRPRKPRAEKGEAPDTEDKPKPDEDTSLDGPERVIAKPKSSLADGPAIDDKPEQPTTLGDPKEIAEAAKPWWKK